MHIPVGLVVGKKQDKYRRKLKEPGSGA
uniref:Uncharacterized protein n=1 Tax=Arundo donax TaxID=35708 RepID=A0A0A8ZAK5_ARUDO